MITFGSVLEAWAPGPSEYDIFGVLCLHRLADVYGCGDMVFGTAAMDFVSWAEMAKLTLIFGIGQALELSESGKGRLLPKNHNIPNMNADFQEDRNSEKWKSVPADTGEKECTM